MDKLKENAFALSLGGVAVVLLALAYFLIYKPLGELGTKSDEVSRRLNGVGKYLRADEVPSPELVAVRNGIANNEKRNLAEALEFYDQKAQKFGLYFEDVPTAPETLEFSAQRQEQIKLLLGFELASRSADDRPLLDASFEIEPTPDNIPRLQKQFWMMQAIVNAAKTIDREVESIDFKRPKRPKRPRGKAARSDDDKKGEPPFVVDFVPVTVTMEMRFAQIREFLGLLYSDDRVPFVDVDEISYLKSSESLIRQLAVRTEHDPKASNQKASFDETIQEPTVQVVMKLRALDWGGARSDESEEGETDEGYGG